MDEKIRKVISDKLDEIFAKNDEITKIISSFNTDDKWLGKKITYDNLKVLDSKSLRFGILVGRLYNSFYYQHRRVLDRNPTTDEFLEFLDFIKLNQKNFQKKLGF